MRLDTFPACLFDGWDTVLGFQQLRPRHWFVSTSRFLGKAVGTGERVVERTEWSVTVSKTGRVRVRALPPPDELAGWDI